VYITIISNLVFLLTCVLVRSNLKEACPDEELQRANGSHCWIRPPYKVNINNPTAAASYQSCAREYACRPRPALHPTVPGDCGGVRVRPRLLHRVCALQHPGGHGVGLHVPPGPPALHPNLSPARSSGSDRQFGEAQLPVPNHGGRVCEDPEGVGGPAEEDQLPQRGGEQQPDGDEAGQAGHRAEDDREWDQGQTERDLPEPDVSTRRHQG